jgi:hypothetical protein
VIWDTKSDEVAMSQPVIDLSTIARFIALFFDFIPYGKMI